ncbi:MAG: AI-2E family transporter [Polyangiaceae bacterium]|nr:AI-2E family transporter [Polyangiaceae bacterium]
MKDSESKGSPENDSLTNDPDKGLGVEYDDPSEEVPMAPLPPPEEGPMAPLPPPEEAFADRRRPALLSTTTSLSVLNSEAMAPGFFLLLFLASGIGLVYVLSPFLTDLVLSFILIGIFGAPFRKLTIAFGGRAWLASGLTTAMILVLIVGPLMALVYVVVSDASTMYGSFSESLNDTGHGLNDRVFALIQRMGIPITEGSFIKYLDQLVASLQEMILAAGRAIVSDMLAISVHLATIMVMVFYMLVDGRQLKAFLFQLSPLPDDEDALMVETFRKVSRGVIVGNGLGSLIQGVLGGLAMWVVGFQSPVFWGAIMTLFAFLPLVGIAVVALPASAFLFMDGQTGDAIGFLAFCLLQGIFVENVVKTKLMGSAMRMHDLLVFMSILGGLAVFGVIGFVYGPLFVLLFRTLYDLYDQRYRPRIARRLAQRLMENHSR